MEQRIIQSGEWGNCLWGIDDNGFLVISEGTAASLENGAPWEEFRKMITVIKVHGNVVMPANSSLAAMFKDCENLVEIDLKDLDTSEVIDMHSMFENCSSIKILELNSFNTEKTEDMGRMFAGCKSMTNLDLSSFDTNQTRNMRNMFDRCNKLNGIVLGDAFSTSGNGRTDCGKLSVRDTGNYKIAKVIRVKGGTITYYENRGERKKFSKETISDMAYEIEENSFESAPEGYKFFGWCDDSEGNGNFYMPGDLIDSVDDDLKLYAIWICPPKVGQLEELTEITYGMKLPFEMPEITSENDSSVFGHIEISRTGEDGTWEPIEHDMIIPASYDGYYMRLVAKNKCGTAYTNAVVIKIRKAKLDFSKVHWVETSNMVYDGSPKQVWLEGIPEGVTPVYTSNYATNAGQYIATVEFEYDSDNFDISSKISDYEWEIKKSSFDMSGVSWDYESPFTYDGSSKSVSLQGLPFGLEPKYIDNVAVNAGIMTASVMFSYDTINYEVPEKIMPCIWEIKKKVIDVSTLKWNKYDEFIFDGTVKQVSILNLPEDAIVEYSGNEESYAGKYLATAKLIDNYASNGPIEYEWEIRKAKYDLSNVNWDYVEPFIYDKQMNAVRLLDVPEGLNIRYQSNEATDAGEYLARAAFICSDPHNYITPDDMVLKWSIKKAVLDMSNVEWTYSEPFEYDGTSKSIELKGIPEGVYAILENASAVNAGVYVAHADLKYDEMNYELECPPDCQWQIDKTIINIDSVKWGYSEPFVYDGEPKKIVLENLPEGLNVEYFDNVKLDSGKYCATAKLTPADTLNYETPKINGCVWAIKKSNLEKGDIVWSDDSEFVYDGTEKTVTIVSDISEKINIEYIGNTEVNAGEHEAVVQFFPTDTKNYKTPKAIHHRWKISKANFELTNVEWDYTSAFTYDGRKKMVRLTNIPEGVIVHYSNNTATDAGDYVAVASFELKNDNYNPIKPIAFKWTIEKASYDMSNAMWQEKRTFSFDGKEKSVKVVGLPDGIVPVYSCNTAIAAGDYVADVEFKYDERNYEKPEMDDCMWNITKSVYDIGNARWDYTDVFVYDGTEKCVRIIDLPKGATVEYSNAKAVNAGMYFATADVIAEDGENYINTSMEDLSWIIEKGEYDMSQVYWDYDKSLVYDGTEKKIVLKGLPEGVTPIYSGNRGVDAGTYTASVTFKIDDYDNYNVPEFASLEWNILKADIDMSNARWNYNNEIEFDGTMHEISLVGLPRGVKPIYEGNCATAAGKYKASVEFVLYDTANYYVPKMGDLKWEIVKANFDMSAVRWDYDRAKIYNSREQGVYLENLPNGVSVKYSNNEAVDAGNYSASAKLTVEDAENYNAPSIGPCKWEILPADIPSDQFKWDYVPGNFIYDGKKKKVKLVEVPPMIDVKYIGNIANNAGEYKAIAMLKVKDKNFRIPEEITCDWKIEKTECDMSKVRWNYSSEFTYDGAVHSVELLGLPKYVSVKYEGNTGVNADEYTAIAAFEVDEVNYYLPESISCQWVIKKANYDISGIRWDYDQAYVYDGREKIIGLDGVPDDVRVEYIGNVQTSVGKYVAEAVFELGEKSNYLTPEPIHKEWEIVKANFNMSNVRWTSNMDFKYDGTQKTVNLVGYPSGVKPIYRGETAVEAGKYVASATFDYDAENYNKPIVPDYEWFIKKDSYDFSNVYWDYEESFVYDGSEKRVLLKNLPDGIEPIYTDNAKMDSGEYFAEVTFNYDEVNYEKPSFNGCKWKIEKADIPVAEDELVWSYSEPFIYDGKPKHVSLTVSSTSAYDDGEQEEPTSVFGKLFNNRVKSVFNSDNKPAKLSGVPAGFEVIYDETEKIEAGVYYAKAILRHPTDPNYKDYIVPRCRWEIKKGMVNISGIRWNYDSAFVYDGEVKEIELIDVPPQLDVKYTNNKATKAGTYEAQAVFTVRDDKNYEKPKPIKGCWWKIDKAKYDMSGVEWAYDDDLVYNGKEKTVKLVGLPEGVRIDTYNGNKATEAGSYTATASFKYKNPENYESPEIEPLRWRIQKCRINTENVSWNYNESTLYVFDEQLKEIKLIGVPRDVDVVYVNNCKINAGTYVAKAKFTYDTKNYIADEIPDCLWKIEKATLDTSKVKWNYNGPFKYDGSMKKIVLTNVPSKIDVRYMDNKATEIGAYTAKAYLTYNTANYNLLDIDTTIEWEIVR